MLATSKNPYIAQWSNRLVSPLDHFDPTTLCHTSARRPKSNERTHDSETYYAYLRQSTARREVQC